MNLPQPASGAPCHVDIDAAVGGSGLRALARHAGQALGGPLTA
jgi:hypothetical protein